MDFKDRQREAMRLAARIESKAAEANSEAKIAGGKEWEANSEAMSAGGKEREPEFLFFYRCHTALLLRPFFLQIHSRLPQSVAQPHLITLRRSSGASSKSVWIGVNPDSLIFQPQATSSILLLQPIH